ncbi:hypothetical protein MUG10_09640 [Xanthomonas prunicola]|uniref:Uncharacterized protein n=1 Tax=Xanthomonas prunicola TaxID=2053930 RepID=A0A9Q9J2D5_9XANT|nr:hypothetical protein [Xanthomonas prunicola]USJ02328.1 hypothetical protein MUG10_09640 [Xanthomonas prunicola]UXA59148.1 hypothetical protein M0D47_10405 [Xanthomonas prunicola]UXA67356.1 hypothetical protein M0D43_10630 [Xanthomonas prunicola]
MVEQAFVRRDLALDWLPQHFHSTLLGGQPAVPNPYTARGLHDTLTRAILAKTENQVTQPTPSQAVPGLSR